MSVLTKNDMWDKMQCCQRPMTLEFLQPRQDSTITYYFKCRKCGSMRRGVRDRKGNYAELSKS